MIVMPLVPKVGVIEHGLPRRFYASATYSTGKFMVSGCQLYASVGGLTTRNCIEIERHCDEVQMWEISNALAELGAHVAKPENAPAIAEGEGRLGDEAGAGFKFAGPRK